MDFYNPRDSDFVGAKQKISMRKKGGQVYLFSICKWVGPGDLSYMTFLFLTTFIILVLINHIIIVSTFYRLLILDSSSKGAWLVFPQEFLFLKTANKDTSHLSDRGHSLTFGPPPQLLKGFLSTVWTRWSFWSILIKTLKRIWRTLNFPCFLSWFRTRTNWNCNGLLPSPPTFVTICPKSRCTSFTYHAS